MKRSATTPEALLKVKEAANRLNLSEKSVYRLIKARKLPVVRCGAAVRIHPNDLRRFIDDNRDQ